MDAFDPQDPESVARFILACLPEHKHFVLSTVDESGLPWGVCLGLSYDQDVNVIWKSRRETEHSRHVRANPHVAVCVFSETPERGDFGFYGKAVAREVSDPEELARLLEVRFARKGKPVPPLEGFLGEGDVRIYCAEVTEAWVTDDRHLKNPVDLDVLRRLARG